MPSVTIHLDEEELKILKKRSEDNFLTIKEQIEDIIRRSCINSKNKKNTSFKCDDNLVNVFSRDRRGRPRKK
jgi:hypothetical protein